MENSIVRERPGILRFIWDMFMVVVVIMNLGLVVFDLTYLRFRATYFKNFPKAVEFYDPILGIEKHRITDDYLGFVDDLQRLEILKDKEKLEVEFLSKVSKYENDLRELLLSGEKKSVIDTLTELEKGKLIENVIIRNTTLLNVYKVGLKKMESELTFDKYTELLAKLRDIERLDKIQTEQGRMEEINATFDKMDFQMVMIIEENPFVSSGQIHLYKKIQSIIKDEYSKNINPEIDQKFRKLLEAGNYTRRKIPSTAVAFAWFWRDENRTLDEKIKIFREKFHIHFDLNYYRALDMNGKPMSKFWELDAPFYILFLLEFFISWLIAIKRKTFIAWFFYPIYHWYDAVALIPLAEVRIVRLLRLYSMFLMLQSRHYAKFGNDIVTRTIRYYSNIIKEELSDMVTIQILTDAQSEIRSGSSMDVVTDALNVNRQQIKDVVIAKMGESGPITRLGNLVSEAVTNSLSTNSSFQFLPGEMKEKIAKDLVLSIFQVLATSSGTLAQSEGGRETIGKIIDFILDEIDASAKDPKLNKLNQDITIELMENIKKQVAVKKWLDTSI